MRIAVVGAGIAGAACTRVLVEGGHEVVVLDRGRVPGGRLASRRFDGRYVDMGASYFTVRDLDFSAVVDDWERRGLARPWTDTFSVYDDGWSEKAGPVRWSAPGGLRSLVTDLVQDLDLRLGRHVEHVTPTSVDGESFDRVVLAMPEPQAAAVLDPAVDRTPLEREWLPVLVLAARWDQRSWPFADGAFVHGSDVLDWVADDGARRGDVAPFLTAHSTSEFARTQLAVPADAAPKMVEALSKLGIPAPAEVLRVQRWTYAKPAGSREEMFHLGEVGLCGDGWGSARVETAWRSGALLGQALCT